MTTTRIIRHMLPADENLLSVCTGYELLIMVGQHGTQFMEACLRAYKFGPKPKRHRISA